MIKNVTFLGSQIPVRPRRTRTSFNGTENLHSRSNGVASEEHIQKLNQVVTRQQAISPQAMRIVKGGIERDYIANTKPPDSDTCSDVSSDYSKHSSHYELRGDTYITATNGSLLTSEQQPEEPVYVSSHFADEPLYQFYTADLVGVSRPTVTRRFLHPFGLFSWY